MLASDIFGQFCSLYVAIKNGNILPGRALQCVSKQASQLSAPSPVGAPVGSGVTVGHQSLLRREGERERYQAGVTIALMLLLPS